MGVHIFGMLGLESNHNNTLFHQGLLRDLVASGHRHMRKSLQVAGGDVVGKSRSLSILSLDA